MEESLNQSPIDLARSKLQQINKLLDSYQVRSERGIAIMGLKKFGITESQVSDLLEGRESFEIVLTQPNVEHASFSGPETEAPYESYLNLIGKVAQENKIEREDLIKDWQQETLEPAEQYPSAQKASLN